MLVGLGNERVGLVGVQVAFIEELQRRLSPVDFGVKAGAYLPISQSSPNLAAAEAAAQQRHHQQQAGGDHGAPFELRALEVALDVVRNILASNKYPSRPSQMQNFWLPAGYSIRNRTHVGYLNTDASATYFCLYKDFQAAWASKGS